MPETILIKPYEDTDAADGEMEWIKAGEEQVYFQPIWGILSPVIMNIELRRNAIVMRKGDDGFGRYTPSFGNDPSNTQHISKFLFLPGTLKIISTPCKFSCPWDGEPLRTGNPYLMWRHYVTLCDVWTPSILLASREGVLPFVVYFSDQFDI